ncbi:MAG: helix-turn-helix domain-containing protein [Rhizobiaceae bacterium]
MNLAILNENNEICDAECPVSRASGILSGKWTTLIIRDLLSGKKRYSELARSLAGISPRMLAARLDMLCEAGLVAKTIYPTVPPKTEYELTAEGRRIEPVIAAMAEFGARLKSGGRARPQSRP